jgi:hypothetical protein
MINAKNPIECFYVIDVLYKCIFFLPFFLGRVGKTSKRSNVWAELPGIETLLSFLLSEEKAFVEELLGIDTVSGFSQNEEERNSPGRQNNIGKN